MKETTYNIRARVVYESKNKVKSNKVIKWFVLLLWSVRIQNTLATLIQQNFVGSELPEYFVF